MAPRLNKRQLREQEELAALQALETPDTVSRADESEGDENVPVAATGFAAVSRNILNMMICGSDVLLA